MIKDLIEMASSLIPPHDGSPEHVQRWRVILAIVVLALAIGFPAHLAMECGWFPAIHGGFAKAEDLKALNSKVEEIQIYQLEGGLFTVRREQCAAIQADNLAARVFYSEKLTGLQRKYWTVVGHDYPLPGCGEL